MPRNNRYNPSPAEREAQRRAATGRSQPDPDQLQPDSSWRLVSSDDFEAQFRRSPWDHRIYDEAMAQVEIGEFSGVRFVQSPQIRGTQAGTADTWMYGGATATEMRMRRELAEMQLREAELRNQINRAVDRIQAGFRRPGDRVHLHVPQPFSLNQDPAEIPPLRTTDVGIDRAGRPHIDDALVQEYRRIASMPNVQASYPVTLKRRNRQPDGSLLDLTRPAEATL